MTSIDIHIIQSVPPSNMNRDDNGSPKTAIYGGVRRSRVSSQAWKRATRERFDTLLDQKDLGVRTKRVAELIAERIRARRPEVSEEDAMKGAWASLAGLKLKEEKPKKGETATNTQYLVFFSNPQLDALSELALASELGTVPSKDAKAAAKATNGISVSLFGRMIADDADLNVDAAVQVAHALSTHAVDPEFDFYTAVDDNNPAADTGAGMMGTIEFNSSTMYRYATVSLDGLRANLGDVEATARAVEVFLTSFVRSMPSGKQNTFANGTPPHGVVVVAREGQGISMAEAFESPVAESEAGYVRSSCEALAGFLPAINGAFGDTPLAAWVTHVDDRSASLAGLGDALPFPELVSRVAGFVRETLGEPE